MFSRREIHRGVLSDTVANAIQQYASNRVIPISKTQKAAKPGAISWKKCNKLGRKKRAKAERKSSLQIRKHTTHRSE